MKRRLFSIFLACLIIFVGLPGQAIAATNTSFPVYIQDDQGVIDWGSISYASLPAFSLSGGYQAPQSAIQQLGYDPSVFWNAGDRAPEVLKLGNIQGLDLEKLSGAQIGNLSSDSIDYGRLTIDSVSLYATQTLGDLVQGVPGLGSLLPSASKPIFDLIKGKASGIIGSTIGDLVNNVPGLSALKLDSLPNLSSFSIDSIPGLKDTPLSNLNGWQDKLIGKIPGLSSIPFSKIFGIATYMPIALHDSTYHKAEANSVYKPYSGGAKDGYAKPCAQSNCAYVELSDIRGTLVPEAISLKGKRWTKGGEAADGGLMVEGGSGILGAAFGNREPAGRPLTDRFKIVLIETDETTGTGMYALYTHFCEPLAGCSPNIIGPFPLYSSNENGPVFLGTPPTGSKSNSAVSAIASKAKSKVAGLAKTIAGAAGNLASGVGGGAGSNGNSNCTKASYGHQEHKEASSLVSVGNGEQLHPDAAKAFSSLKAAAASSGFNLFVVSGFRSISSQSQLWSNQISKQGSATAAAQISAPPGFSEHHTGYALDVGANGVANLSAGFENTPEYDWLDKNAAKYGFEQSFTRSSKIGAQNEPWHWRFIGTAEAKEEFTFVPCGGGSAQDDCTTNALQAVDPSLAGPASSALPAILKEAETAGLSSNQTAFLLAIAEKKYSYNVGSAALISQYKGLVQQYISSSQVDYYGAVTAAGLPSNTAAAASEYQVALKPCQNSSCSSTGRLIRPTPAAVISPFGMRLHPIYGTYKLHAGIDFGDGTGTPIKAADCGTVDYIGWDPQGYGNFVDLKHPSGLITRYAHMSKIDVRDVGQQVQQGEIIGLVGSTGGSTGPHLHFETRQGGQPIDPSNYGIG